MRKGDIVQIRFLDHAQNVKEALEFVVWGRVCNISKTTIAIQTWAYPDSLECSNQTEGYAIAKKLILESVVLVPVTS